MPINVRAIAVNLSVVCFFAAGLFGWCSGLTPFTCCKRALAGAFIMYIVATISVKAVNAILTNAMITSHINKNGEKPNDTRG